MKLRVERTLGIIEAEIDLEPGQIVEVVGPNASGKTSIATCAQAVLSRESNPLGLSGAQGKTAYPHDGADDARVELGIDGPDITWYPNSGRLTTGPGPAPSNPEAVGLVDFTARRGAKERAAVFQGALLPDAATVLATVKDRLAEYLPADDLAGAMEMLEERGWEATAAVYEDRARQAKREWRDIANRTYGVRVAADWRPDGWLADYDHLTVQQAEELVVEARDALNALHRVQAVTEAELAAAEAAQAQLPEHQSVVNGLQERLRTIKADSAAIPLDAARDVVSKLEDEHAETIFPHRVHQCPHCQCDVVVVQGVIHKADDFQPPALRDVWQSEMDAAVAKRDELAAQKAEATKAINEVENHLQNATGRMRIAERDAAKTGEVDTPERVAALASAEQQVEDCREVVRLVRAESEASRLHNTIARYTEIARALGPEGVRAKMLEAGLRKLNGGLATIARESGWPLTEVAENGTVTMNERPVALCSESERWRAQAAIQLTLAAITGSQAVVLDRADLLDGPNRSGLERAVSRVSGKTGIAVLLCSTWSNAIMNNGCPWRQVTIEGGKVVRNDHAG